MSLGKLFVIFWANTLLFAIPWAFYEIYLFGLGQSGKSGLPVSFSTHIPGRTGEFLAELSGHAWIEWYHIAAILSLAALLYAELHLLKLADVVKQETFWSYSYHGQLFAPLALGVAVWFGIMLIEDFLFFLFNYNFPGGPVGALETLFSGQWAWHTRWVDFYWFKLPDFYLTTWIWIFIALFLARPNPFGFLRPH